MSKKIYVAEYFVDGEGISLYHQLTKEQIEKAGEILGVDDLICHISKDHPVKIKEISMSEHIRSMLMGEELNGAYGPLMKMKYLVDSNISDDEREYLKDNYPKDYEIAINNSEEDIEEMDEKRGNDE